MFAQVDTKYPLSYGRMDTYPWNILEDFAGFLINFGSAPDAHRESSLPTPICLSLMSPICAATADPQPVPCYSLSRFHSCQCALLPSIPRPASPEFVTFSIYDDGVDRVIGPSAIVWIDKDQSSP